MFEFIGRLHPLLVHLPIGIIGLALLIKFLNYRNRWLELQQSLYFILGISLITVLLSAVTGIILSNSGDYEMETVNYHKWAGIGLTLLTGIVLVFEKLKRTGLLSGLGWSLLAVCWLITGHLGGSITHGASYLFQSSTVTKSVFADINMNEAYYYEDIVKPILENKCYGCHSQKKQKGKLRLDSPEWIMKGGKNGKVVKPNQAEESSFFQRVNLDLSDDDHMPPEGKPQLSRSEIEIIGYWITDGADFNQQFIESPNYSTALAVLDNPDHFEEKISFIPSEKILPANPVILDSLKKKGVIALPVGLNSNYISVNLLEKKDFSDGDMKLFDPIKEHITWFKAGNTALSDSALVYLGEMKALTILHLNNTKISDKGLSRLIKLTELKILNLGQTQVSESGLSQLSKLPNLKSVYLFKTEIDANAQEELKLEFKGVDLDFGGYEQLFQEIDTMTRIERKSE